MAAYQDDIDSVFRALADPGRRRLLDSLNGRNGQTLRELCGELDMARQSVSKHLAILEAANLVTTVRRGREKLHYLNAAPINEIGERWITRYERERVEALADLKRALEDTVDKPSFVYTTYIRTTPERLWQALTEPEFTSRYWRVTFDSDWKAGSAVTWNQRGLTIADPAQVVIESDPYRRLSYRWHTFTPELSKSLELTDDVHDRVAAEPRSKVTFDLEPRGELVKLTVVHDDFEPESLVASMVSQGWPRVLSSLKTLLETGETLPDNPEPLPPERLGLTA
ncbi:MAG TPA: metalloregulator ArsR/SmtB family transcription factor [Gaiellaceae bacterium]